MHGFPSDPTGDRTGDRTGDGAGPTALAPVLSHDEIFVVQRKDLAEQFLGFESRNKYVIQLGSGQPLAFAAEQGKDLLGTLSRYFLGHWRTFEIHVFDQSRQLWFRARHPFRILFQRLEVELHDGRRVGAIQRRFAFFSKRFDVEDADGRVLLTVESPLWKPWTFAFQRPESPGSAARSTSGARSGSGSNVAMVEKKWSGALTEIFTDADRFRVSFSRELGEQERLLVLAGALLIDLAFFERANT